MSLIEDSFAPASPAYTSLTPKDWTAFQHYRNRAPIWIKLHRSLLNDYAFHRLPLASRALAPMLWLLASEYEGGRITADRDEIAFRLRITAPELDAALGPLIARGLFLCGGPLVCGEPPAERRPDAMPEQRRDDTDIKTEMQDETDAPARASRDRVAPDHAAPEHAVPENLAPDCAVPDWTASDPIVPDDDAPDDIAPERMAYARRFDEFMQAYPRRDGANPRKPAEKKYDALVRDGADEQLLIDEARKFAAGEATRGSIGTRFIPMAVTWLSQERFSDIAASGVLTATAPQSPALELESIVKFYARTKIWSRHAGPAPGDPGCRAPPELLARFGVGVDGRRLEALAG